MQPTGEYVLYQDAAVLVSNYRVVLFGRPFATNTISCINISEQPGNRSPGINLMVMGFLHLVIGLLLSNSSDPYNRQTSEFLSWVILILQMGIIVGPITQIVGLVRLVLTKPKIYLWVANIYGGSDAVLFPERAYAERVAQAISMALT